MAERDAPILPVALELHYRELTAHFTRKLGSASLAVEMVHEAYMRVRQLPAFLPIENPRAYLFRVVANLVTDYQRRERWMHAHSVDDVELTGIPDRAPSPETVVFSKEQLNVLTAAIRELPPQCRTVFILHKFKHLRYVEVSQQLGISKSTVVKHMIKALDHCHRRLDASSP